MQHRGEPSAGQMSRSSPFCFSGTSPKPMTVSAVAVTFAHKCLQIGALASHRGQRVNVRSNNTAEQPCTNACSDFPKILMEDNHRKSSVSCCQTIRRPQVKLRIMTVLPLPSILRKRHRPKPESTQDLPPESTSRERKTPGSSSRKHPPEGEIQ